MQIVFQMRYSFFGTSGWRSKASRNPERLFDTERLTKRAYFFEKVALASLASQTDSDFKLVVLSSVGLPVDHKNFLEEICKDTLGERAHIIYRKPGHAGNFFRRYQRNRLNNGDFTMQVVLDDDDGVSYDFVEVMRQEALFAKERFVSPDDYTYLSQARGITAVFEDNHMDLAHKVTPFVNLGLALVAPTQTKRNPFFTAHKNISRSHPVRVIYGMEPYYLRAVHDTNDSRAMFDDNRVANSDLPHLIERFPLLEQLLKERPRKQNQTAAE